VNNLKQFIVQYVGFKTNLETENFVSSWQPFASRFKSLGIISLDLYKVEKDSDLNFISRNVWDLGVYFKNFPSGIAGYASSLETQVEQFGGYLLDEIDLIRKPEMKLSFLKNQVDVKENGVISRIACRNNLPYIQVLDYPKDKIITFLESTSKTYLCEFEIEI